MMSLLSCRCVKGSDTPVLMGRISGWAVFSASGDCSKARGWVCSTYTVILAYSAHSSITPLTEDIQEISLYHHGLLEKLPQGSNYACNMFFLLCPVLLGSLNIQSMARIPRSLSSACLGGGGQLGCLQGAAAAAAPVAATPVPMRTCSSVPQPPHLKQHKDPYLSLVF